MQATRTDSPTKDDTYYFYSPGGQVLEELKVSNGDRIHSYVWGTQNIDDIVMRIDDAANSEEYYVLDVNNNVIGRLDYQGNIFERYTYSGYGEPVAWEDDWGWRSIFWSDEDLYLFTGRQYHLDHAQYDYRARWQDPALGVFVTRDPIGIWGDQANFGNGYMYAGGDPISIAMFLQQDCHQQPAPGRFAEIKSSVQPSRPFNLRVVDGGGRVLAPK